MKLKLGLVLLSLVAACASSPHARPAPDPYHADWARDSAQLRDGERRQSATQQATLYFMRQQINESRLIQCNRCP